MHAVIIAIAFILFWVPVGIFAKLAGEVIERQPLGLDLTIITAFHSIHSPFLNSFFLFVTSLGSPLVVAVIGAVLVGLCLYKKWYRGATALVAGVGGATVANLILKGIFARTRPSIFTPLVRETSYSFPSGHAMVSSAFVFIVILLLWHTKYRIPAVILGLLATLLIGLSRIYLGVHYPSDVIAGWSVGLVWAVITGSLALNRPFALGHRLAKLFRRKP